MTTGVLVASVGALLTFLAAFLTWASVDVTSRVGTLVGGGTRSTSGLEGDRLGKATLVLALAAIALCVLLIRPTSRSWGWIALTAVGGLIVLLAVLDAASISDASDLRHRLAQVPGCSPAVQCTGERNVGVGVWLTIAGGVLVVIGALLHHGLFDRLGQRAVGRQEAAPRVSEAAPRVSEAAPRVSEAAPRVSDAVPPVSQSVASHSVESAAAPPAESSATDGEATESGRSAT